jgi:hypothetical protein
MANDSALDIDRLENVKRLDGGSIRAACPACRAADSDKSGEHLLIKPDGSFGCAVHAGDREHRKVIFRLARKQVALNGNHKANGSPAFDWQKCLDAFTEADAQRLAQWRGYSLEFVRWLNAEKAIGIYNGNFAFPNQANGGDVVSCHVRLESGNWMFKPKGYSTAPLVFGDAKAAQFILCLESQWDALAVMDRLGWHLSGGIADTAIFCTRGTGNAGLIRGHVSPDAKVFAFTQNDKAAQTWLADVTANAGCKVLNVATPQPHKDANDWTRAGATADDLQAAMRAAKAVQSAGIKNPDDDLQRAIADERPKLRLPGPDRLLSDFATELGQELRDKDIYYRNGEIVILDDGDLKTIPPQAFRCWAEKWFIGYRAKTIGENTFEFNVTMSDTEARGTLAAPQFIAALRRVRCVNHTRLPILDKDGKLTLLPDGYHEPTQTLTLASVNYDLQTTPDVALETIKGLLSEFCFADGERSKAVTIAAMIGLFANQLLPNKSLRPCFIFTANAEGAGKSLLVQICFLPTLGAMPTGCKSTEDDEIRKNLTTAILEARQVVFFDNLKGRLSSPALEAFLSAPIWTDRKLKFNETVTGENLATCFVTGNGMTVSPDMRRRSLFVELHLEVERAEDRQFKRLLDLPTLLAMRPEILSALWAIVRNWDAKGRPGPSRGHSAFPSWANIIGGIVEAAGFDCPLKTANVAASADPDSDDMRKLVEAMADKPTPITFADLVLLARENGLFESIIGPDNEELGRREKSALGRLLTRYDRRMVLNYRFLLDGKGHARRYRVETVHGDMVEHGHSDCGKSTTRV